MLPEPEAGRWFVDIKPFHLLAEVEDYCLLARPVLEGDDVPRARFNGLYRENEVDEDGDGNYDYVVLEAGLDVKKAGRYFLEGSLHDLGNGRVINVSIEERLNFGSRSMELCEMRTPGPYQLSELNLYDEHGDVVDRSKAGYTTEKYPELKTGGQETSWAVLNSNYSDYGSDIDGDGFFDYLTVDAGVDVFAPDNYSLAGFLFDASGKELVWSMGYGHLVPGTHIMHMDFDGKTLWLSKANGPYSLCNLVLSRGDSNENMSIEDIAKNVHVTRPYNYTQFVDPVWPEKTISGSGSGEILLTISVESTLPVFQGRYSSDIVGVQMPPISSNWTVKGFEKGYAYDLPGIHMPNKPNNFTVIARGAKNLNVGVRKEQSAQSGNDLFRTWVSSQVNAGKDGSAVMENDLISPGRYHFKIFGDAANNTTEVALELKVVKKLVINGDFDFALNTDGLPKGNYSINIRALSGRMILNEVTLSGLNMMSF